MAARSHVQGNSVSERRLRPIYDWLDGGYNKKALQEADKVLRKTPNLQCAKALKALALLRLGKESECISLLNILAAENPFDDPTLQAMTICYRELHQYKKVCDLYETAIRQDPNNEDLHTHLFMSYVRILDFKQQQKSAMALYKFKPKNPYYFWGVMSVVLQATRNPDNVGKNTEVLLTLARRMIDKLLDDNRIEAEQELQLYLMILKLQNNNEDALKLLESPLGNRLLTDASTYAKIPFLINLKMWRQVNSLCSKILTDNADLWDIWKHYLTSVFEIMKMKGMENNTEHNMGDTISDDTPEKCHDFICTLMECSSNAGPTVRGPWLARLELYVMMEKNNFDPKELLGDFLELLVEYFKKFGHKPCCVYDMKVYIKHLPMTRRSDLSSKLLKDVGINSTTLPQTKQQMLRHISSLQLSRLCGAHEHLNKAHLVAFVTALALHYQHGSNTYNEALLSTDAGPADPYALLSAHVLYDVSLRECSSAPLILAITILENLLKSSPSNHHAKLLCVRLYHCLGAGYAAHQIYETLDIKHIQLDSVAFIHATQLPVNGPFSIYSHICYNMCTFFSANYKDTADHLTFSYKYGSFLKLEELLDFRERLNNSMHKFLMCTEKKMLDLIQCNSLQTAYNLECDHNNDVEDYGKISDNRDLNVIQSFDPIILSDDELNKENRLVFEQDKELMRLRTSLHQYILTAIKISSCKDAESRKKLLEELQSQRNNYENVLASIENANHKPTLLTRLAGQLPSRLHSQLALPYKDIIGSFVDLICDLAMPSSSSGHENENESNSVKTKKDFISKSQQRIRVMTEDICNFIKEHRETDDYNLHKRRITESVINVVEVLCLVTLLSATGCELIKTSQSKKHKKKNVTNSSASLSIGSQMKCLVNSLKGYIETFDQALQNWWNPNNETVTIITDRLNSLYLSDGSEQNILTKLNISHITLIKEIHNLLKDKLKLLSTYS